MPTLNQDKNAFERKRDHIELTFQSQVHSNQLSKRFYYEPLLAAHPKGASIPVTDFFNKRLKTPIWVSSMTGGTVLAKTINHNLAKACKDFGMGMGLGSCRSLLHNNDNLSDFQVRGLIGDAPLFANLGIAQVEQLVYQHETAKIKELISKLEADGLIVHINPFQEWLQPEGDRLMYPAIQTLKNLLEEVDFPVIVKEVGQGMGYESLKTLLQLPLAAIDFAASGGTNFSKLELLRSNQQKQQLYHSLALVGHTANDMVDMVNDLLIELGDKVLCRDIIISGGIKDFLDGYYLIHKIQTNALYGQASAFLKHARNDYDTLYEYVEAQIKGLELAYAFLRIRN